MCEIDPGCRHLAAFGASAGTRGGRCCSVVPRNTRLRFEAGARIYEQGESCRGVYCVLSGMAAVERADSAGRLVILRLLRPGAFFACQDMMGDGIHRSAARALTGLVVCHLPDMALRAAAARDTRVAEVLLRAALDEVRAYEDLVFDMATDTLPERLYALLSDLAEAESGGEGNEITFTSPLLRKEMAAMLGTSASVLSRTITRLEECNLARFTGQQVTLRRPPCPVPQLQAS